MHYDAYAFAIDRNIPTITAKDGSTSLGNFVGFSAVIISFQLNGYRGGAIVSFCNNINIIEWFI